MEKHYRAERECLNCGYVVAKAYCSNCGQENLELKEPFWHFIGHSISHYFHFDSKFFHTLKPLLTEPGRLTLEYLAGRRTRFLHPVSMYIFVSIVYFLVVPPLSQSREETTGNTEQNQKTRLDSVNTGGSSGKEAIPFIEYDSTLMKLSFPTASIRLYTEQFKKLSFNDQGIYLDKLKTSRYPDKEGIQQLITELEEVHTAREDSTYAAYLTRQKRLPEDLKDNRFQNILKKREIAINQKTNENWTIKKEVQKYNPKLYFLLMPLFAFFLMLNFRRNKKYYIEHLIFTIHFFTAFFIFQIVISPVDHFIFNNDSSLYDLVELTVILWYIYTALRVFYQRQKWATIRKIFSLSMLLLVAYAICYGIIYSTVYMIA